MDHTSSRTPSTQLVCRARCHREVGRRAHHDALLRVENDTDAMLDLFETAVTWAELDHPADATIPPARWVTFAEQHQWQDPERMCRIFGLATDIALRGVTLDRAISAAGR